VSAFNNTRIMQACDGYKKVAVTTHDTGNVMKAYTFLYTHSFKLPRVNSPVNSTLADSNLVCRRDGRKITAVLQTTHSIQYCISLTTE